MICCVNLAFIYAQNHREVLSGGENEGMKVSLKNGRKVTWIAICLQRKGRFVEQPYTHLNSLLTSGSTLVTIVMLQLPSERK